jgi:hypothetical protein
VGGANTGAAAASLGNSSTLNNNHNNQGVEIVEVYQRVSITLQDTVMVVRIIDEDTLNPPYFIENKTNYEIYYRQQINS